MLHMVYLLYNESYILETSIYFLSVCYKYYRLQLRPHCPSTFTSHMSKVWQFDLKSWKIA